MEQSACWEADIYSAEQEFLCFLYSFKQAHNWTLSWGSQMHCAPHTEFFNLHFKLSSHVCVDLQNGLFPSGFLKKNL